MTVVHLASEAVSPGGGGGDNGGGVVGAQVPAGQLGHAVLVWYGTLGATLGAAILVVTS